MEHFKASLAQKFRRNIPMLSWAGLEAVKQNSGHHPVEKNEVNHQRQMAHPVVEDTPTGTSASWNERLDGPAVLPLQAVSGRNVSADQRFKTAFTRTLEGDDRK